MSFRILLVLSILLGTLLGAGAAYAHLVANDLYVGRYYYYGLHDHNVYGHEFYFWMRNDVEMSSNLEEVTVHETRHYAGDADEDLYFGPTTIYEWLGEHSVSYTLGYFWGSPIDGCDITRATYWYYDGMDAYNDVVFVEQVIWLWAGDDWTSLGSDLNGYETQ